MIHSVLAFSTWLTGRRQRALAMAEEMLLKTGQMGQLMGQSSILAIVALPLSLWSGQIDVVERFSTILGGGGDLEREKIAL